MKMCERLTSGLSERIHCHATELSSRLPRPAVGAANLPAASVKGNDTAEIAMDARPGGPPAKREPSPEGLGINPEDALSAVGATLNLAGELSPIRTLPPFSGYVRVGGEPFGTGQ